MAAGRKSAAFDIVKSDVSDPNNVLGSRVSINLKGSGLILPDNLTWTVSFSGVSGGNEARAIKLYAGGYYYEAKRKRMLDQLVTSVTQQISDN